MNRRSRVIAINAILIALVIIFTLLMNVNFFLVATAVFPLIIIAIGSQLEGWLTSLILATVFGGLSCIGAFISPSPLAPIFQNPLISVLPRVLIGLLGYAVYKACTLLRLKLEAKGKIKKDNRIFKLVSSGLGGAFTSLFNTLFVLSAIWLGYAGKTFGNTTITVEFVTGLVSLNFVMEIVGTAVITPLVVMGVSNFIEKTKLRTVTMEEVESGELDVVTSVDEFFESKNESFTDDKANENNNNITIDNVDSAVNIEQEQEIVN